jgi:hypothetical protein
MTRWSPPPFDRGQALSLDPSLDSTGYGVLDFSRGVVDLAPARGSWRSFGTINHPEGLDQALRRTRTVRVIRNLVRVFRPEVIIYEGIEGTLFSKSQRGQSNYGWMRESLKLIGAIECIADWRRRPCRSITPVAWKHYYNIPMGSEAGGEKQKRIAVATAKDVFNLTIVPADAAEALLLGKACLEKYLLKTYGGQLSLL